jgi:hypothetical protein
MNDGISWEAAGWSNSAMALLLAIVSRAGDAPSIAGYESKLGTRGVISVVTPFGTAVRPGAMSVDGCRASGSGQQ